MRDIYSKSCGQVVLKQGRPPDKHTDIYTSTARQTETQTDIRQYTRKQQVKQTDRHAEIGYTQSESER